MMINKYVLSLTTSQMLSSDTFLVDENTLKSSTVYLSSDDPSFASGAIELNNVKKVNVDGETFLDVFSENKDCAILSMINYILENPFYKQEDVRE